MKKYSLIFGLIVAVIFNGCTIMFIKEKKKTTNNTIEVRTPKQNKGK
jgi:hypothetical protein